MYIIYVGMYIALMYIYCPVLLAAQQGTPKHCNKQHNITKHCNTLHHTQRNINVL